MTYAFQVIHPVKLDQLASKTNNAFQQNRNPDFVVVQPLPAWKEVYSYFERPDAETRRSNLSMTLFYLLDREIGGSVLKDVPSCKAFFNNQQFVLNLLKLTTSDRGILSIAFTLLNSNHDKTWDNVRERIEFNLNSIYGSDAYEVLKRAETIPYRITDEILKMNLLESTFNLRQSVRSSSPVMLKHDQFEVFFGRVQRLVLEGLWKRKTKRVSSRSFDSVFDFVNTPTLIFEENVLVLMKKLESEEKSDFIDDLFDYVTEKINLGLINPSCLGLLTEDHLRRLSNLAGVHSYDLIEKTSSILARITDNSDIKKLINNRIDFWTIFKKEFNSIRIFVRKELVDEHEVFRQRRDLKRSMTYTACIIRFDEFWFVQYLEKKPGVTYGFYFFKDNEHIHKIFNSDIFTKETVRLIRKHADKYTVHGPDWQNHLARHFKNVHGFHIPSEFEYLLRPARKPGGELLDNDLDDYNP
jgi:hypothetical protein